MGASFVLRFSISSMMTVLLYDYAYSRLISLYSPCTKLIHDIATGMEHMIYLCGALDAENAA